MTREDTYGEGAYERILGELMQALDRGQRLSLEDVIRLQLPTLYTGYEILSCHPIRVTRDAEISLPRRTAADLLTSVEAGVRERRMGDAVRLQHDAELPAPLLALLVTLGLSVIILWAMGRPPICTCGTVTWWGEVGPNQSQMLADWYSPSHIVHGFLFYAAFAWKWSSAPVERRFLAALLIEAAWEIAENTPMVIDRYREATMALGYSGDSVINSASDIAMMAIGFLAARRLPVWASVAIVLLLELIPLIVIRDNLTLNVIMLLAPSDAILNWQSGA